MPFRSIHIHPFAFLYRAIVAMSNIGNITAITIVATITPIATMISGSKSVANSRSFDSALFLVVLAHQFGDHAERARALGREHHFGRHGRHEARVD